MALVRDKDWVKYGASAFGWLAPGELRLFGRSEQDKAPAGFSLAIIGFRPSPADRHALSGRTSRPVSMCLR